MKREPISERSDVYNKYHASDLAKKRRAARNAARRAAMKKGLVRKGDGKEIDHKNPNTGGHLSNSGSNVRVVDRKTNRSRNNNGWRKTKKRNT